MCMKKKPRIQKTTFYIVNVIHANAQKGGGRAIFNCGFMVCQTSRVHTHMIPIQFYPLNES